MPRIFSLVIRDGTLAETCGTDLVFTNYHGTLDGLTVNGDLDLASVYQAYAYVVNGHDAQRHGLCRSGLVTSVAFTPVGRHLISGSQDKTVKAWDLTRLDKTLN